MTDLVWQDPPHKPYRRGGKYRAIAAELEKRPGRWALVYHKQNGGRPNSQHNIVRSLGCEATVRRAEDGGWDLYARWPDAVA